MHSTAYEAGRVVGTILGVLLVIGVPVMAILSIIMAIVKRSTVWIVTAVAFIFIGLVGGGVMAFAIYQGYDKASKARVSTHTMVSSDGEVSLDVPGSWSELPELSTGAQLKAGNKFAEQYAMIFSDSRQEYHGTLEDFSKLTTGRMAEKLTGSSTTAPEPLTINGFPALRVKVYGSTANLRLAYLHTSVETPQGFHQILQWSLAAREKTAFPVFEKVASSFKMVKGDAPLETAPTKE